MCRLLPRQHAHGRATITTNILRLHMVWSAKHYQIHNRQLTTAVFCLTAQVDECQLYIMSSQLLYVEKLDI